MSAVCGRDARERSDVKPTGEAEAAAAARIAFALEAVAAGDLSASSAMSQWPEIQDGLLEAAWHELSHFENDADIRRATRRVTAINETACASSHGGYGIVSVSAECLQRSHRAGWQAFEPAGNHTAPQDGEQPS